jgi:hypothetical protein
MATRQNCHRICSELGVTHLAGVFLYVIGSSAAVDK